MERREQRRHPLLERRAIDLVEHHARHTQHAARQADGDPSLGRHHHVRPRCPRQPQHAGVPRAQLDEHPAQPGSLPAQAAMRDAIALQQLQRHVFVPRRHLDGMPLLLDEPDQGPEKMHVHRVGHVEEDAHALPRQL